MGAYITKTKKRRTVIANEIDLISATRHGHAASVSIYFKDEGDIRYAVCVDESTLKQMVYAARQYHQWEV